VRIGVSLPKDADGCVIVTVADILEYLEQFPKNTPVTLDHDGWMEDEEGFENVQQLIKSRGLFQYFNFSTPFLCINN